MDFDTFPMGKETVCPECGQTTGYKSSPQERAASLMKPGVRRACLLSNVEFDEKKFYRLIGEWDGQDFDAICGYVLKTMVDG